MWNKIKTFVNEKWNLVESIVASIIGAVIVIADCLSAPIKVATVVLGSLIALAGALGIVLHFTDKTQK